MLKHRTVLNSLIYFLFKCLCFTQYIGNYHFHSEEILSEQRRFATASKLKTGLGVDSAKMQYTNSHAN